MKIKQLVGLARYHNKRGVKMLKCARSVEGKCRAKAFTKIAKGYFKAARSYIDQARIIQEKPF